MVLSFSDSNHVGWWFVTNLQFGLVSWRTSGFCYINPFSLAWLDWKQLKEKRFKDASRICQKLALEGLTRVTELSKINKTDEEKLQYEEFRRLKQLANVLYAYSFICQSINEPFRITMPETLFNISRFLLAQIVQDPPTGHISIVNILVTLAKRSEQLGELLSLICHCNSYGTKGFMVFYVIWSLVFQIRWLLLRRYFFSVLKLMLMSSKFTKRLALLKLSLPISHSSVVVWVNTLHDYTSRG